MEPEPEPKRLSREQLLTWPVATLPPCVRLPDCAVGKTFEPEPDTCRRCGHSCCANSPGPEPNMTLGERWHHASRYAAGMLLAFLLGTKGSVMLLTWLKRRKDRKKEAQNA